MKESVDPFDPRSPYERLEISRRKRLILAIINGSFWALIPFAVYVTVTFLPVGSTAAYIVYVVSIGSIPVALASRWFVARGKLTLGALLFLLYWPFLIMVNSLILEGLMPVVVPALLLLNVVGGMMLKPAYGYILGILSAIIYITVRLITLDHQFVLQMPRLVSLGLELLVIGITFVFSVFINNLTTRDLRRSLDDATFDLLRLNEEVQQASDRKSQFTARTSHELRTPLSAIIVFSDLTLRGAYGPISEELRSAQQHIATSARHLKRIINDLLDLSKIEAGEFEINEKPYELGQIVDVIESTCQPLAESKQIEWSVEIDDDMPRVLKGDAERVTQIAVNLTGNAFKFTDEGRVWVRIEPIDDKCWHLLVRDTGPGIPEDQQELVFEAFRSLDKSGIKSAVKSTGLGLAIARNLAQMMGGDIELESTLGEGSTFTVRLPLVLP
ncbi:MAG: ATP-binding protein [Anaerolineales bacterium]